MSVSYLHLIVLLASFQLPEHIEILVSAVTGINEPDSLYGILQSHKVSEPDFSFS